MTDSLRDRVIAMAEAGHVDEPQYKLALAVAALAVAECEKACAPYTKHPHTYASENADRYRGFRDGALACEAAIRARGETL